MQLGVPYEVSHEFSEGEEIPESIPIHVLDAAACVTATRSPLKQFMQSKLHIMVSPIPTDVLTSSPGFSAWSGISVADD